MDEFTRLDESFDDCIDRANRRADSVWYPCKLLRAVGLCFRCSRSDLRASRRAALSSGVNGMEECYFVLSVEYQCR